MDHIPFTKVSIEEAKAAMQSEAVRAEIAPLRKRDWSLLRAQNDGAPQDLAPSTFKWLAALPKHARPQALPRLYPRIVNRLADIWKRPLQCERYLDALMLDQRGDRIGFPREVAAEIAALKMHFFASTNIVHFGVWGNRLGVD